MIAVVDYGVNNLRSVVRALEAGGHAGVLTSEPEQVQRAERVLVPGVGNFGQGSRTLVSTGLADAVREVAKAAGFGQYLVHGLGHGIGARVHEGPSSSDTSTDVYQAGEVTTVEPGLYLPGWGGVRIEDVGVVEDGGFRNLTTAPKNEC